MDITSELTASSSLSPKDTCEVTSLVEGEVLEALFEEGDVVEKDQVLYRIDASSMDSDLSSAETSLLRARESQQSAQEDYNEAAGTLSGNTYPEELFCSRLNQKHRAANRVYALPLRAYLIMTLSIHYKRDTASAKPKQRTRQQLSHHTV